MMVEIKKRYQRAPLPHAPCDPRALRAKST